MALTLRPARPADAATLADAEREVARVPGRLVSRPHELRMEAFEAKIGALAERGRYVVAEQEGRIVGHALLDPLGLEAIAHVFRLTIVVHPGNERRGIGRALMQDLLDWAARSPEVGKVELAVRATNQAAIALYRQMGFVEEGRLAGRIRLPDGTRVDDLLMAWTPPRGPRAGS